MNPSRWAVILLLMQLAVGCALMPVASEKPPPADVPLTESVSRLQAQARALRYSGRYAEALERLDLALTWKPGDPDLDNERQQTEQSRRAFEQELADRLLVLDAESRLYRLPLLRKLVRSDPGNPELRAEMDRLGRQSPVSAEALSACGARQAEVNAMLARRCLTLALQMRESKADSDLLADLGREKNASAQPKSVVKPAALVLPKPSTTGDRLERPIPGIEPLLQPPPPSASQQPPAELLKARKLIDDGNLFGAVRVLEKLDREQPGSDEVRFLLSNTRTRLGRDTAKLLEAGDSLYQEGKVKEALAVWQAALALDPFNPLARQKSERALRVLTNMQAIREQSE